MNKYIQKISSCFKNVFSECIEMYLGVPQTTSICSVRNFVYKVSVKSLIKIESCLGIVFIHISAIFSFKLFAIFIQQRKQSPTTLDIIFGTLSNFDNFMDFLFNLHPQFQRCANDIWLLDKLGLSLSNFDLGERGKTLFF